MRRVLLGGVPIVLTMMLSGPAHAQGATRVVVELGGKAVAFLVEKKGDVAVSLLGATVFDLAKSAFPASPSPGLPPAGSSLDCRLGGVNTVDCVGVGRITLHLEQSPSAFNTTPATNGHGVQAGAKACTMADMLANSCDGPNLSGAQAWLKATPPYIGSQIPAAGIEQPPKPLNAIELGRLTRSIGMSKPAYCAGVALSHTLFPECN
ncbi:MAG: hypothetical protein JO001_07385 [Alphaproteobacteria bacterium]|nr:hypothetical protein [Alphaproteobacteria bacterium]